MEGKGDEFYEGVGERMERGEGGGKVEKLRMRRTSYSETSISIIPQYDVPPPRD